MTQEEFTRRKRALYTGMMPYLDSKQIMEALILWEQKYANTQVFSARFFVADLARVISKDIDTKALLANIQDSWNMPDDELSPDPTEHLNEYRSKQRKKSGKSNLPPEMTAFKLLVTKLLQSCPPETADELKKYVIRKASSLDIDLNLKWQIVKWLGSEGSNVRVPFVKVADLRKVINLFYIGMCERLGPVKSDELLFSAVNTLKVNGGREYFEFFKKIL